MVYAKLTKLRELKCVCIILYCMLWKLKLLLLFKIEFMQVLCKIDANKVREMAIIGSCVKYNMCSFLFFSL